MKRILFFTLIAVAILSMIHSLESVYNLWQKRSIILQMQREVQKNQAENTKLKQQMQVISQQSFVEEEARDKLFMVKPGEKLVFLPARITTTSAASQDSATHFSNWQQWWNFFF